MNILVTGSNGFLGSHLARRLLGMGDTIYGLVRPGSTCELIEDLAIHKIRGDVCVPLDNIDLPEIDVIFHLAATMGATRSQLRYLEEVNVGGTQNVINFAIKKNIKRLIHVSSTVAFGASEMPGSPLTEESGDTFRQRHLKNFESKRLGQDLVIHAVHHQNLDAVIVNPSLIFGPGDARKLIRRGNIKIAKGQVPIALPGGVNVVSVQDVVDGMIAAWKKGRKGECYILGGENILTKDLFTWISEAAQQPAPTKVIPAWLLKGLSWLNDTFGLESEVNREAVDSLLLYHWCDSSKAKKELDYEPKDAKQAVMASVQWMKTHGLL